jgi:carotenoid cleavage dioxygenase
MHASPEDIGGAFLRWPVNMNGPGKEIRSTFNVFICIDLHTGKVDAQAIPPAHAISEPVHVSTAGSAGWLVSVVDHQTGDNSFEHAAWIIAADEVAAGPVAKVEIPHGVRPRVDGCRVPQAARAPISASTYLLRRSFR